MATDKSSQWREDKEEAGASDEAVNATPRFSGDDIEFESFMFDSEGPAGGTAVAQKQAAPSATANSAVSATMDDLLSTSGPLYEGQPAIGEDIQLADFDPAGSAGMPAFSLDASGPVDTAPVDPADMIAPVAFQPDATEIAGEDVPLPSRLQTSEPEIPPFVPEVPIQPQPARSRTIDALKGETTGPLSPSIPSPDNGSGPLNNFDALAADGWTDSSLSVVEDFSSVLLAMQAGSHFPMATDGAAVVDAPQLTDIPVQTPAEQEASQHATAHQEPQASAEPGQAVGMPEGGAAIYAENDLALDAAAQQVDVMPDSAQTAAPVLEQAAAPQETSELDEGQFKGADLEFESFMFTSPGASAQPSAPAFVEQKEPEQSAQGPTAMSQLEAGSSGEAEGMSGAELPFWLQTGELPALSDISKMGEGHGKAANPIEDAMANIEAEAADPEMEPAPTLESGQQDDYADLPPIDPFDFSLLAPVEEEESLGFNLQELEGMIPAERVSTKVTTDLSALAEFLGTKPHADMLKYQTEEVAPPYQQGMGAEEPAQEARPVAPDHAQAEAAPPPAKGKGTTILGKGTTVLGKGTSGLRPQAEDATHAPSWTSTVTSGLSPQTRAQVEQQAAEAAAAAEEAMAEAAVKEEAARSGVETLQPAIDVEAEPHMAEMDPSDDIAEIEIDPFNYTELDLDDEETATEQLANMAALTSVLDTGGGLPTTPVSESQLRPGGDLASGIPLDTGSFDVDNETSFFTSGQPTKKVGAKSTGWLSDTEGQGLAAENDMRPAAKAKGKAAGAESGSRARVARPSSTGTGTDKTPEVAQVAPVRSSTPAAAADYVTSGPLPTMEGFETLQEMADRNPEDLSTQMALASAFAQSGEYDSALRVYRRALKKRNLSLAMLEVIADELSDIEPDASDLPRFHQVLGDLYMKQGRYKDAIDEYNKIG